MAFNVSIYECYILASGYVRKIAGLGNHVSLTSRHSVGMQVCNALAKKFQCDWEYERIYKAYITSIEFPDQNFVLLKSKWPMNLNGKSVLKIVSDLNVDHQNITVIHDDLDRSLGKLSWKLQGSANGHNGVKSVMSCLQSDKFRRLRVGIGRPDNTCDVVSYVLNDFNCKELTEVDRKMLIEKCAQVVVDEIFPKEVLEDGENT